MAEDLDLIVLGSGPGGYVAAIRAGQLGLRTVVVEKDPQFGGTCLHRGCIPTKAWLHTAEVFDQVKRASDFGILLDGQPTLDLEGARQYRRSVIDKNARGIEYLFRKNDVETVNGFGRLVSPSQVEVDQGDETTTLSARNVLIATGSVPASLRLAPVDGERVLDSDHILELDRVPSSLVVLGAGAVGVEFASIYASLGSVVTLVEMLPRVLPVEDEEISGALERALRRRNITVLTGTRLAAHDRVERRLRLRLDAGGEPKTVETEVLLVAVGRTPVIADIGLEEVGVEVVEGCIAVDPCMQTSVEGVYAIGDVVKTPWLAHLASAEGIVAVEHMAGREPRPVNYDRVPSCTYCEPEVASVGLTEAEAKARGYDVATGKFPFSALGKAAILGKSEGFVKVVRETKYDELLGVHILGAHATDLIAEACLALQVESTTEDLFRTIHAHPTLSEALAEAGHAAVGQPLHI